MIEAIRDSAFVTSEYPVILSFENHCRYTITSLYLFPVVHVFISTWMAPTTIWFIKFFYKFLILIFEKFLYGVDDFF